MTDISHIRLTGRPLIISDVDDVILEFIEPYERFLDARGLKFLPRSFRLTGNVVRLDDETPVSEAVVKQSLHDFFDEQQAWQKPFAHAMTALPALAEEADIVFLTAMPPKFTEKTTPASRRAGADFSHGRRRDGEGADRCDDPRQARRTGSFRR